MEQPWETGRTWDSGEYFPGALLVRRLGGASGLRVLGAGGVRGSEAGFRRQLASRGFFLNSAEGAMECRAAGTGPEISRSGLILQQVASARIRS